MIYKKIIDDFLEEGEKMHLSKNYGNTIKDLQDMMKDFSDFIKYSEGFHVQVDERDLESVKEYIFEKIDRIKENFFES